MAMIKCRECGAQVSNKADFCPQCGAKPKPKTSLLTWIVFFFFAVPVLISVFVAAGKSTSPSAPAKPKTAEELRIERIEKGFSAWDGSHRALERWIKNNLKDPDSYEHIETRYGDKGEFLLVRTKYRARNGFGGMTIGEVGAKTSIDGEVIEIVYSE